MAPPSNITIKKIETPTGQWSDEHILTFKLQLTDDAEQGLT